MSRYGSDKPDTRFGMEIQDITETVKDIDFVVFKSAIEAGGSVRAINVKGGAATYTRKEIDKLVEHAKGIGAKGLAYIRWADEPNCSFKKFLGDGDLEKINAAVGAEKGRPYPNLCRQEQGSSSNFGRTQTYLRKASWRYPGGQVQFCMDNRNAIL